MATQAAATRSLQRLGVALAQNGLMTESDAEALQTQAQQGNVTFVEQLLQGKRLSASQLAAFAARAFGVPLMDLAAFDLTQIRKDLVDVKIAQSRRVLPLHKRGNRLYVATSDPANLQALEEVRFKTNLVVEPVVVEDDKLGKAIEKVVETLGKSLKDLVGDSELLDIDLERSNA